MSNFDNVEQENSFPALCIKKGIMQNGEVFCIKGKIYKYILVDVDEDDDDHFIRMKGEEDSDFIHSMNWRFFFNYYIKDEKEFIKVEEMEL